MLPLIFAALFAQQWQGDFLLPSPRFHAIGLVSEQPVKGQPGEKFQTLRLNYKVVTQGGQCHWAGVVRDARARTLLRVDDQRLLPKGEALLLIEVPGGEIEAFAADGPLVLANMQVDCGDPILSEGFMDPRHYITGTIHAKDYRHVNPDFELTPSQPRFSGHVGDAVRITMAKKYLGAWNQLIEMHLEDLPTGVIPSSVSTGWDGFEPRIARSAAPGVYTVRAVAKSGSLEHSIAFELEILPPREPLFPADGSEPATPSAASIRAGTAVQEVLDVGAAFRAEVDLRPMNVVLVVQHGGSLAGPRCDAMKQLATYFVQQFVEGRDNVGVVGFNDGVFIVDPIREDFKTGPANTLSRIAALRCEGSGGVHAYALEVAYQQLRARSAPAALNMIVMLAAAPPSKIAAEWPVRTKADRRYVVNETQESQYRTPDQEVDLAASPCSDTAGWRASFAPTRPGTWFWKPDGDFPALLPIGNDCTMSQPHAGINAFRRDIAYIPDADLLGIPFSGALELERFLSGPYAGRIRSDSYHNLRSAAINNFVNAARTVREDNTLKPVIDIIAIKGIYSALTGLMTPELLAQAVGEHGVAYLADQLEDFPSGFDLVFRDVLHRAQIKK